MKDWDYPHELEPRPKHRATAAEQEALIELIEQVGMIASHIGVSIDVNATFRPPRKRRAKPEGVKP